MSATTQSHLPRLLLLTDRCQLQLGRGLVRTVAECAQAGLSHVLVREHDLEPAARTALVAALVDIPDLVVISSRIPEAAAHGLHQPSGAAARRTGPGMLGRSCHTRDEVEVAAGEGVDYVTLSPFAASQSKPGYGPPLPTGAYAGLPLPAYALGGITPENAAAAVESGAHGVAVMGAVMRDADPAAVVARLLEASR